MDQHNCRELKEERNYEAAKEKPKYGKKCMLAHKSSRSYLMVFAGACASARKTPNLHFVDGPAKTGKTVLSKKLLHFLRSDEQIVVVVAVSTIAEILLEGGRTVHTRFCMPFLVPLTDAIGNISTNNDTATLLCHANLLIWDKVPNAPRSVYEAVDRALRDIWGELPQRSSQQPRGGLPIL